VRQECVAAPDWPVVDHTLLPKPSRYSYPRDTPCTQEFCGLTSRLGYLQPTTPAPSTASFPDFCPVMVNQLGVQGGRSNAIDGERGLTQCGPTATGVEACSNTHAPPVGRHPSPPPPGPPWLGSLLCSRFPSCLTRQQHFTTSTGV
jgi:hypothetical protein